MKGSLIKAWMAWWWLIQGWQNNNSCCYCEGFLRPGPEARVSRPLASEPKDDFDTDGLSERIRQIEQAEQRQQQDFLSGLQQRVKEVEKAKDIEFELFQGKGLIDLPVVCFDALLPRQKLQGSTQDSTFMSFLLEETGLGGWFVMTSLEYRSRKVRRNGVLCKVEYLDAAAHGTHRRLPTSLDFVIQGFHKCRIEGSPTGLEARIGRWRRIYDDNGEESVLGWGTERLTDLLFIEGESPPSVSSAGSLDDNDDDDHPKDPTQWTKVPVRCHDLHEEGPPSPESLQKAQSLVSLVEEWYSLASKLQTYQNPKVTASVKVDPEGLLRKVTQELGERPDPLEDPTGFCFWVGGLINPIPPLGVSLEIRGNLLESRKLEDRLTILETGIHRSIQNLKGERPL